MQQGPDAKPAANGTAEQALPGANFGPKYEAHVSEMQNKLDEASKRYQCLPSLPLLSPIV